MNKKSNKKSKLINVFDTNTTPRFMIPKKELKNNIKIAFKERDDNRKHKKFLDSLHTDLLLNNYEATITRDFIKVTDKTQKSLFPKFNKLFLLKRKIKKDIHNFICINMELRSGKFIDLFVNANNNFFVYSKGSYIIDQKLYYYNKTKNMFCLDYHQDFCLPVKRLLPVTKLQDSVENIPYATNPNTLKQFIVSKIAEGIMRGAEIEVLLKRIAVFGFITFGIVILHFIIYAYKSGLFKGIV